MKRMEELLAEQPFFCDFDPEHLRVVACCGRNRGFRKDAFLFREGDLADRFWMIRSGKVALETPIPGREPLVIQTLGAGSVVGWSWFFPPYRWHLDARALETTRATEFDGNCLREKCDADPALGYDLIRRFARIAIDRLQATRLQLIDVYGKKKR